MWKQNFLRIKNGDYRGELAKSQIETERRVGLEHFEISLQFWP